MIGKAKIELKSTLSHENPDRFQKWWEDGRSLVQVV